jgi:hypothetical protein
MKIQIMRKDVIFNDYMQVWVSRDGINCEILKVKIKTDNKEIITKAIERFNQIDGQSQKEIIEKQEQEILAEKNEIIKDIDINVLKEKLEIKDGITDTDTA